MNETRFKVNLLTGDVEFAGTEEFVKECIDNFQDIVSKVKDTSNIQEINKTPIKSSSGQQDNKKSRKPTPSISDFDEQFASFLEIPKEKVQGALAVSNDYPFLHLDIKYWSTFKKLVSKKMNFNDYAMCATIASLFRHALKLDSLVQKDVNDLLKKINVDYNNPGRNIKSCEWLRLIDKKILINPAKVDIAINLCRVYCTESADEYL